MMGELSTRVPARDEEADTRQAEVRPVEARLGESLDPLPEPFRPGAGPILVLSTSCGACEKVAGAVPAFFESSSVPLVGIAVSSASEATAVEFVARHGLGTLPTLVDPSGTFSKAVLGVEMSPTAVAIGDDGAIASAVVFGELSSLEPWLDRVAPELSATAGAKR